MSEKNDNLAPGINAEEIQIKIQEAKKLMESGHHRESLILYLEALQQSLKKLQQVFIRLQTLSREQYLRLNQDLHQDRNQEGKKLLLSKPPTLH